MGDIRPTVCVFAHGGARGDCSVRRQLEAARDVSGRARRGQPSRLRHRHRLRGYPLNPAAPMRRSHLLD